MEPGWMNKIRSKYIKAYRDYNLKQAKSIRKDPNFLRINDIYMSIPPQSIHIDERYQTFPIEKIRRSDVTHMPDGYGEISITLQLVFTEDYASGISLDSELRYKLIPLLTQVNKNPLVQIENSYISTQIVHSKVFSTGEPSFITGNRFFAYVEAYSIQSVPGMPKTIACTLQIVVFNHKPYVPYLSYRSGRNIVGLPELSLDFYKFYESDFLEKDYLYNISTPLLPDDSLSFVKYGYIEIPGIVDSTNRQNVNQIKEQLSRELIDRYGSMPSIRDAGPDVSAIHTLYAMHKAFTDIPLWFVLGIMRNGIAVPNPIGHTDTAKRMGLRKELIEKLRISINYKKFDAKYGSYRAQILLIVLRKLRSILGNNDLSAVAKAYYSGEIVPNKVNTWEAKSFAANVMEFKDKYTTKNINEYKKVQATPREMALLLVKKDPAHNRIVYANKNFMVLQTDEKVYIDTSMMPISNLAYSVSFYIARIPISGNIFPTLQYMGVANKEIDISFTVAGDVGHASYAYFKDMLSETQLQYSRSKYFSSIYGIRINNSFINNALGVKNILLKDSASSIDSSRPNVTIASVSFTDTTGAVDSLLKNNKLYSVTNKVSDVIIVNSFLRVLLDVVDTTVWPMTIKQQSLSGVSRNDREIVKNMAIKLINIIREHLHLSISKTSKEQLEKITNRYAFGTSDYGVTAMGIGLMGQKHKATLHPGDYHDAVMKMLGEIIDSIYQNRIYDYDLFVKFKDFTADNLKKAFSIKLFSKEIGYLTKIDLNTTASFDGNVYKDMKLPVDINPDFFLTDANNTKRHIAEKLKHYTHEMTKEKFSNFQNMFGFAALNSSFEQSPLKDMFEEATISENPDAPQEAIKPPDDSSEIGNPWLLSKDDIVISNKPVDGVIDKKLSDIGYQSYNKIADDVTILSDPDPKSEVHYTIKDGLNEKARRIDKEVMEPNVSLREAYPAAKVYIVEDDFSQVLQRDADDLFELNTIQEVRLIRSREIAADLAIIRFYDVTGYFTSARFYEGGDIHEHKKREIIDTEYENPFSGIMLREGVKIHIRMGYNNDPNKLEPVFTGIITNMESNGKSITLVAQSHAIELVSEPLGDPKKEKDVFSFNADTQEILYTLIARPELRHFGRYVGMSLTGSKQIMPDGSKKTIWAPTKYTNYQNIYAPYDGISRGSVTLKPWLWFNDIDYYLTGQTVWDVFQEMTLRHPGYIAIPRYYFSKNLLMTMYFGPPSGRYIYRDKTVKEDYNLMSEDEIRRQIEMSTMRKRRPLYNTEIHNTLMGPVITGRSIPTYVEETNLHLERTKPIVKYHTAYSGINLIKNSIHANTKNVYTKVKLYYPGNIATIKPEDVDDFIEIKMDDNLYREDIRETVLSFPNCVGERVAYQYGTGVLVDMGRHMYDGELYLRGDPTIEPYDIIFISDESSNTSGPISVRQVEHVFTPTEGFITVVTPDMVVNPNDMIFLSTLRTAWIYATSLVGSLFTNSSFDDTVKAKASAAVKGSVEGGLLASFGRNSLQATSAVTIFVGTGLIVGGALLTSALPAAVMALSLAIMGWNMIGRSRYREPIVLTPLIRGGVPFVYGIDSYRSNGIFADTKSAFLYKITGTKEFLDTYLTPQRIKRKVSYEISRGIAESINNFIFK